MKILDKYILKKYLGTFLYLVFGLCLIICVIDYSEKKDDFLAAGLSNSQVFLGYYVHMVPYLANFLSPLMVFISTILVTATLASHTEIIAILASGVSFKRVVWIYIKGAIVLSGITFYLIGWVIPQSNARRIDFELSHLEEEGDYEARDIHLKVNDSSYIFLQHYNEALKTGYHFTYEVMKGGDCVYRLKTSRVEWDSTTKAWACNQYSERTFRNGKESYQVFEKEKSMSFGISPKDFGPNYFTHQILTIPELKEHIEKEKIKGTGNLSVFYMEYYERFTYPFAILILTFMGVVVSARKSRDGIAKQLMIGFVLCFVYYGFLQLGRNFTQSDDIHPLLSAWIPNIVFVFAGAVLYRTIPK
jgi:lipopolysaccharide export system permease protein